MRQRLSRLLDLFPAGSPLRRVMLGTAWGTLGTVASRMAVFASALLAARLLGRERFGEFGIIQSTVTAFATVGSLGMGLAATKLVAERRLSDPSAAGRIAVVAVRVAVAAGALLGLALFASAGEVARRTLDAPALVPEVRLAAAILFFVCCAAAQFGVLAGLEAFPALGKLNVLLGLLTLLGVAAGARLGGLTGAVAGMLFAQGASCLVNGLVLRVVKRARGIVPGPGPASGGLREVWRLGLPAMLASALFLPVGWACATMLVHQPGGYRQMAIFAAADQWYNLVITLPAILAQAFLPVLSNTLGQAGSATVDPQLRVMLRRVLLVNAAFAFAPLVVVAPLAGWLIRLYGPEFAGNGLALVLAVATGGLTACLHPATQVLIARDRLWLALSMNATWGVLYLGATQLFVVQQQGGAVGLILARGVAYVALAIWTAAFMARVLRGR